MLDYMSNNTLRRRVKKGLNKVEFINA